MSRQITRRQWLGGALAAGASFTIVPRHVLGGPKFVAPSDKVNIGVVGVGGQGQENVRALFQEADAQIIAVADPIAEMNLDAFYFKGLAGRGPVKAEIEKHYAARTPNFTCAAYEDFRVMLKGHHRDWLDACKGGTRASSHFGYGAKLTEIVLLGVLSLRAGQRIYWDAANLKARNLPAADALIHGTYRDGWKVG